MGWYENVIAYYAQEEPLMKAIRKKKAQCPHDKVVIIDTGCQGHGMGSGESRWCKLCGAFKASSDWPGSKWQYPKNGYVVTLE